MPETIRSLNKAYLKHLKNAKSDAVGQFKFLNQYLTDRNCTFKDKPMPSLLKPNFVSEEQTRIITWSVEKISSALNKFIYLFIRDEEVRRIMNFSSREEELFTIEPGYDKPLVISRLDAFQGDMSVKFLEFNCDSPAGIAYADIQEDGFRELFKNYPIFNNWKINYFRRQERLLNALIKCYNEYKAGKPGMPDRPVIAIIDWVDVSTYSEFMMHEQFFSQKGYKTVICSPFDLTLRDGRVYAYDTEIHLIYKRVITRELLEKWDEVAEFIRCLKEGRVCCCNPFRSYIVGNKKVLQLISDPRFQHIYSKEELKVIQETIPWTRILSDTTVTFQDQKYRLKELILDNKDLFVLKPANMYGGKDVFIGMDTDQPRWEEIMNTHLHNEDWVVQEFVEIPMDTFPEIGEEVRFKKKYVNINPFALLEKYAGAISRVSNERVINVSAGGGLIPTLTIKRREKDK